MWTNITSSSIQFSHISSCSCLQGLLECFIDWAVVACRTAPIVLRLFSVRSRTLQWLFSLGNVNFVNVTRVWDPASENFPKMGIEIKCENCFLVDVIMFQIAVNCEIFTLFFFANFVRPKIFCNKVHYRFPTGLFRQNRKLKNAI